MAAGFGAKGHAEGVAQTEYPNARPSRARPGGIIKWIAGKAITSGRIDPEDFPAKRINQLSAKGADIFFGLNNANGKRLGSIAAIGRTSDVDGIGAPAVPGTDQQGAIVAKDQAPRAMGIRTNRNPCGLCFADQDQPSGSID
jgi:hypothetical protein